ADKEYLPQTDADNDSSLFRYDYRYLSGAETGKEPVGAVQTLDANDSGYALGAPAIRDISMTAADGAVSVVGRRLELPLSKDDITVTLSFEIYDGNAGLKYQAYIRNDSADKRLQITSSDVIRLDFPDAPRN